MEEYSNLYNEALGDMAKKKYAQAVEVLTSAIEENADAAKTYFERAKCYRQLLRPQLAIDDLHTAIKLGKNDSSVYFQMGLNQCQLKDYRKAIKSFDNVIKIDDGNKDALLWKAECQRESNKPAKAILTINDAIDIAPKDYNLYLFRSYYNYLIDKEDRMLLDLNLVIDHDSGNVSAYLMRGLLYCNRQEISSAETDFKKVLDLDYGNSIAQKKIDEIDASKVTPDYKFEDSLYRLSEVLPKLPYQNPKIPVLGSMGDDDDEEDVSEPEDKDADEQEHHDTTFDDLVGLDGVKKQIKANVAVWQINRELKKRGLPQTDSPLSLVFDGNSGTGKTKIAELLSKHLNHLGIVPEEHFIIVTPKNLVSPYPDQSSDKTQYVLDKIKGGTLLIKNINDLLKYKENNAYLEVLDQLKRTLTDKENQTMIILSGEKQKVQEFMEKTDFDFQNLFDNQIDFKDYTNEELLRFLTLRIKQQQKNFDSQETLEYLQTKLNRYFLIHNHAELGNAHFVQKIVNTLNSAQSLRLSKSDINGLTDDDFKTLTMEDVKAMLLKLNVLSQTPIESGQHSADDQLQDMIGLTPIKKQIKKYIANAMVSKKMGELHLDLANMNMIFAGSAGTGKTTVARLFSQIMYEYGILKTNHFNEVSARDLVASYVGQTAPKTHKQVKKALGGILFIDEAYALQPSSNNGDYNREAVDQLVKDMEDYKDNLVVVLAGYTKPMEHFLNDSNPGLRSRFNHWVTFPDYSNDEMLEILDFQLNKQKLTFSSQRTRKILGKDLMEIFKNTDHNKLGNARFIRQVVANLVENKNLRLVDEINLPNFDNEDLHIINRADVDKTFNGLQEEYLQDK